MKPLVEYWSTRCGQFYTCILAADGTFETGPAGWTAERTAPGTYEITHNLGDLNYTPLVTAITEGDYKYSGAVNLRTADVVRVSMFDSTQARDVKFALLIVTL